MKNRIMKIFMLLLALFVLGACGDDKVEDNNENKVDKEVKRDLKEEEINELMQKIDDLAYMDFYNKDIMPVKLTNQEALRLSYEIVISRDRDSKYNVSFAELEKTALDYLGFSLEAENLICDTHFVLQGGLGDDILVYNVNNGMYEYNDEHLGHGAGGLRADVYNSYVEGYESNGTYTIVVNKIFSEVYGDITEGTVGYFATYEDALIYENRLFSGVTPNEDKFIEYKDKLVKYTYVFKLVEDSYVLDSYKIGD